MSSSSDSATTDSVSSSSFSTSKPPSNSMLLSPEEINHIDRNHVWHPYTAMPSSSKADDSNYMNLPIVKSAHGCELSISHDTNDDLKVVDGMSSWWACIHGYNHPVLNKAATDQIENNMSHIMFGGLTHEPAAALAKELINVLPRAKDETKRLDKIFYSDSGSVAIEVAMKMALQYWFNVLGSSKKDKFLTIKGGYHGDTFHAMSVCDPVNGMHHLFQSMLPKQIFCDRPKSTFYGADEDEEDHEALLEADVSKLKTSLEENFKEIAAVILEPIVQGAGGMYFYSPAYLKQVRELCDEYDVLLICDEIATGFGRTGKLFAIEHAVVDDDNDNNYGAVIPDILCLGKALSGGMMSFAATITSSKIASAFDAELVQTNKAAAPVFMHGPTFMGNPLACAVSLASLQLLQSYDWKKKVTKIESQLKQELDVVCDSPFVDDVRVLGAIGVIEMKQPINMKLATQKLVHEHGVWLRPFGKLLYTMPPFVIDKNQLTRITKAMISIATTKHL